MKRVAATTWLLTGLVLGSCLCAAAAPATEDALIEVLRSNASLTDKDAACALLKRIGTARCVPALAALLTDEQLSHSARYALESMRLGAAGEALVQALPQTSDGLKVGIIDSLAVRGESWTAPALIQLLSDRDPQVVSAAAYALGTLGGNEALRALERSCRDSSGPTHGFLVDGLLRAADRALKAGNASGAARAYRLIYEREHKDALRLAAYGGMIRSAGQGGLKLMLRAIAGPPGPAQTAALQLVHELSFRDGPGELAALLPRLRPSVQIALLRGLAQRGDTSIGPSLAALASHVGPAVQVAIIQALDSLGDASNVPLLAGFAANGTPDQQAVARLALRDLRRGPVADTLVDQIATSAPAVQAELARALGERGDRAAVPKLLELAQKGPDSTRHSALRALGQLIQQSEAGLLVRFLLDAKEAPALTETAEALTDAYQRFQATGTQFDVQPLVKGVELGHKEARIALLPVCSTVKHHDVRTALLTGLRDPDPQVHAAAVRALCGSVDPELLEDVVGVAIAREPDNLRTLAIAGGVRLATQEESGRLSRTKRLAALKSLLSAATRPEQKRMVLAGLGEVPDREALQTVAPLLEDSAVQSEAARAAVKIACALPSAEAQTSAAILQKGIETSADEASRQALTGALKQIEETADFITDWQVAGPYSQAGRNYAELFDAIFPAEVENAKGVNWRNLPAGADPQRPWVMDLLKAIGGEQRVAYARTWVHCDQPQNARLEFGSDDGIKIWLNDRQVYALNVARRLQPGSDQVLLNLHPGWNRLLLKVTQNKQGWEFCARLRNADGSHLEGLRIESAPISTSAPSTPTAISTSAPPSTAAQPSTAALPSNSVPTSTPASAQ